MAGRIKSMRAQLLQALKDVGAPGTWDHVVHQIGMFSFLGVTKVNCCFPYLRLTSIVRAEVHIRDNEGFSLFMLQLR